MKNRESSHYSAQIGAKYRFRIILTVLALVFGPFLFVAPAAHAGTYDDLGGKPGQECRPKTLGNKAGSGFPGLVDPAPKPIVPNGPSPAAAVAANTLQTSANNSIYHVYGWAGYSWEICATGGAVEGAEALGNTPAYTDNEIGSTMLKGATAIAALNAGVSKMAANPGEIMKPLDDVVITLSNVVKTTIVDLWLPLILVGAGVIVAVNAMNKNTRKAVMTVGLTFAALLGIAYLSWAPLQAAKAMDGITSSLQTTVTQKAMEASGKKDIPAEDTLGVLYTDDIIFPLWASGLTNWDSNDARLKPDLKNEKLGTQIKAKQKFEKFTPTQAYQIRSFPWDSTRTEQNTKDRRDAWNTIGEASQTKDAPTRAFVGQDGNRTGSGFMALASTLSIAIFNVPASAMGFVAGLAFRLLPMAGLVALVLMIFEPTRALAVKILRYFLGILIMGVMLGIFSGIHLGIVSALFGSNMGFLWATVLTAILSFAFYKITNPVRALFQTVKPASDAAGRGVKRIFHRSTHSSQRGRNTAATTTTAHPEVASEQRVAQPRRVSPLKRQQPFTPASIKMQKKAGVVVGKIAPKTTDKFKYAAAHLPGVKQATNTKTGALAKTLNQRIDSKTHGQRPTPTTKPTTSKLTAPATQAGPKASSNYGSLRQAQSSAQTHAPRQKIFVPPNAQKAPVATPRRTPQKGDRPALKKYVPPSAPANQKTDKTHVQPLKSRS